MSDEALATYTMLRMARIIIIWFVNIGGYLIRRGNIARSQNLKCGV